MLCLSLELVSSMKVSWLVKLILSHFHNCRSSFHCTLGESCPETKTPVPDLDEPYCTDIHKRHTLFCGTQVLQTRYYGHDKVKVVVIRTGFTTAKGELVRSILYPKPIGFRFYMDSIKFVLLLLAVALCGVVYCVYVYITKGVRTFWNFLHSLTKIFHFSSGDFIRDCNPSMWYVDYCRSTCDAMGNDCRLRIFPSSFAQRWHILHITAAHQRIWQTEAYVFR